MLIDMSVSKSTEPWLNHYGHPIPWETPFPPLSLPAMFAAATCDHGTASLVDFLGRTYSYSALYAQARAFASGLQAMGINQGDRVGLYLPNVPVYIPAYFGAMMMGATVVNFSPLYTAQELEAQVADSGTRLLVTVDLARLLPTALQVLGNSALETLVVAPFTAMLPAIKALAFRIVSRKDLTPIPARKGVMTWRSVLRSTEPKPVTIDPEHDLALLQYTGGTTGTPKGAMLTHQNLSANARQINGLDPHRGQRDMIVGALPLFHVFANSAVLNRTVLNGGCIAMLPRFDAALVFAEIKRLRPSSFPGVPTMFQALLESPKFEGADLSSLRVCIAGGAPLPVRIKERWEAATGVRLVEGYGLTESSGVVTANPYDGDDRIGTIGQPLAATRLILLDREDPTRLAPRGVPGELAISGPQVMQGYWRRPEEAKIAFAEIDGTRWLRTGDVGVLEEGGYFSIVDRIKDMISVGGFKVFPSQVEHVMQDHPAVKDVLVLGVPDDYKGEVPRAYVTLIDGAAETGTGLKAWLNDRVGKHERVDAVVVRQSLPRTMIGKLDRKALREEEMAGA